jgi:hypothetical protein
MPSVVHDDAERGVRCLDERRIRAHADRLLEPADGQSHVDTRRGVNGDGDALAHECLESRERALHLIASGLQERNGVIPIRAGDGGAHLARAGVRDLNRDAGQHGTGVVGHHARQSAAGLCERRGRRQHQKPRQHEEHEARGSEGTYVSA